MSCETSGDFFEEQCTCNFDFAMSAEALELGPAYDDYKSGSLTLDTMWKQEKGLGEWLGDCCKFESRNTDQAEDPLVFQILLVLGRFFDFFNSHKSVCFMYF